MVIKHVHTDDCWEPDSGCDMGRSDEHAVAVPASEVFPKNQDLACECGHSVEEHPSRRECIADDCHCIYYEPDDPEESSGERP